MALILSTTIDYGNCDASSVPNLIADMVTRLTNAGWTDGGDQPGSKTYTFSGLPSDGQVFQTYLNGGSLKQYTFKTALTGGGTTAYEVLIGGSAAACATNLSEAINAGANGGTDYGSSTTQNPDFAASPSSGSITITTRNNLTGNRYQTTHNLSNVTPTGTSDLSSSYQILKSAQDAKCTGCSVKLLSYNVGGASVVGVVAGDWYESLFDPNGDTATMPALTVAGGRTLKMFASPFWACTFLPGSSTTPGTSVAFGSLFTLEASSPAQITAVSGTDIIANGFYTIGGVASTTVDLDTTDVTLTIGSHSFSVGDKIYVLGVGDPSSWTSGGYVASESQSWRTVWVQAETRADQGTNGNTWRQDLSASSSVRFVLYNTMYWTSYASGPSIYLVGSAVFSGSSNACVVARNVGEEADILTPRVAWPIAAVNGTIYIIGYLPDAYLAMAAVPKDPSTLPTIGGKDWIPLTDSYRNGLVEGCLFVRTT